MKLKDRVAVITGAGSGIGRAIALALARRGCHLALTDINEAGACDTAAMAQALGVRSTVHQLDVANREAVANLPAAVLRAQGQVDLVINNAGVALAGNFDQVSEEEFDWLMAINFEGVVRMTRAFLPLLRSRDEARLVNVSSLFGLISPPGQAAYSASKFAVRGFSNALRHELAGTNVGVTVVHPGGVATSIARSARVPASMQHEAAKRGVAEIEKSLRLTPEKAGEIIVRGIEADRARVLVGLDAVIVSWLERLMPVNYWRPLAKLLKT